ncbi:hypothetical protein, partial [Lonsdalea populi]|uniref:hypothetical protein n=1 Tax=Lonsdalea populi TaxID=1172565 RepID=UPI003F689C44
MRDRLVGLNRSDSRDNLIANLSFGTWTQLLGAKHDELWNRGLRTAFPNAMNRKQVHELAEAIRRTRNKVAHHNYLRTMDVPHAMDQVFQLAELISPEYARWMKSPFVMAGDVLRLSQDRGRHRRRRGECRVGCLRALRDLRLSCRTVLPRRRTTSVLREPVNPTAVPQDHPQVRRGGME